MTSSTDYPLSFNPVYQTRPDTESNTITDWIAGYDEAGDEIYTVISFDYYMSMGVPYVTAIIHQGQRLSESELKEAIKDWNQRAEFELQTIKYK